MRGTFAIVIFIASLFGSPKASVRIGDGSRMVVGYQKPSIEIVPVSDVLPPVTYVQFDGVDDRIKTGLTSSGTTKVVLDGQCTDTTPGKFFGNVTATKCGMGINSGSRFYCLHNAGALNIVDPADTDRHIFTYDPPGLAASVDDTEVTITANVASQILQLGCLHNSSQFSAIKIYRCRIWQGGTLVRDFRAVADGTMVDKLTGTIYYNKEDSLNTDPLGYGTD